MLTKYTDNIEYIYHYTHKDNVENILKEKVIRSNKDSYTFFTSSYKDAQILFKELMCTDSLYVDDNYKVQRRQIQNPKDYVVIKIEYNNDNLFYRYRCTQNGFNPYEYSIMHLGCVRFRDSEVLPMYTEDMCNKDSLIKNTMHLELQDTANKDRRYKQNIAKTVIAASIATTLCLGATSNVYADDIIGKTNVGYTQNVGNKAGWLDDATNYDTSWYLNASEPYNIGTAKELAGLAFLVNKSSETFSGKTITITADIDLSEYDWETIANTFSGTIDGTHKIILAYGDGPLFADSTKGTSLTIENESNQQVADDKVYINNVESYSTTVKEGEIVEKMSARADITIDVGVSYRYRWGTKDSAGNFKPIEGVDNMEFAIPEELNEGSYTYYCQVLAVDMSGNTKKEVLSKPIQITVTKGTRKVIFDAGHGEFDGKEKTVTKNIKDKKIDSLPKEPKHSKSNRRFAGWYTKSGEKVDNPLSKEYENTTRLIAWYNRFITVEFDTKGGQFPDGTKKYVLEYEEESYKTINDFPKDPTKKGYKFLGWYYILGGEEREVSTYDGANVIYPEDADEITIYAKWEKIKENKDSNKKVEENKGNKEGAKKLENVPKTRDEHNLRRWNVLMGLSMCISLVMLVYKKIRKTQC